MAKQTVRDIEVTGKTVLMRVDFNVPIQDGLITDDNRIVAALPTIRYVLERGGKVVLFSHLGRVKTPEDLKQYSLAPVAERLSELLEQPVQFIPKTRGEALEQAVRDLAPGQVLLVENTRFEDLEGKKESGNDPELGAYWASLGDVFVNDAFGTAHRAHASNVGIAKHLPSAVGLLVEKEIQFIGEAVNHPKRPFIAILGGAKVSDKIGVIEQLLKKADHILIGGGMSYTFKAAKGEEIGTSLVEPDKIPLAKALLERAGDKIVLPIDFVCVKEFSNDVPTEVRTDIPSDMMSLDIGPATIQYYTELLSGAKTVVWNGPMGVFEMSNFANGTIGICKALAQLTDATTIIGGGDSAAAAIQLGFAEDFTHISTGGGASLEYLEGHALPGIECITDK